MKHYLANNVWNATQERLKFLFDNFDNIYVSFSGGKDSGLLLNLVLDYNRHLGNPKRIGVFHQDFEAQYEKTTEFVTRMFVNHLHEIEPFWECLPKASRTAVSNQQIFWYPWEQSKKEIWVRNMPEFPWIINEANNPFDFYQPDMSQESLYEQFGLWYSRTHEGRSVCLLGIRADESLNRYRASTNDVKETLHGRKWTTKVTDRHFVAYPLYDWQTEDVWIANAKRGYDYNKLYDLFHKAGLTIHQMRVASPFHEYARHSLNLYRVLEPATWCKIVGRVNGANFAAIYGGTKALGFREIKLPIGHTWKSYTKFLLKTLPQDIRDNYVEKFSTSIKFWNRRGGVVSKEAIEELNSCAYRITVGGRSNRSRSTKNEVVFNGIPDATDDISSTHDIPSWKRMAFCILKNDHLCKFMGFSQTKKQLDRRNQVIAKYKNI